MNEVEREGFRRAYRRAFRTAPLNDSERITLFYAVVTVLLLVSSAYAGMR